MPGEAAHVVMRAAAGSRYACRARRADGRARALPGSLAWRCGMMSEAAAIRGSHVGESRALAPGQGTPRLPIASRARCEDRSVGIGDVLDVADHDGPRPQVTDQHVEHRERAGVTEMSSSMWGVTPHT